jgi:prepilin-type N-terminal cleavage/methylation domain-containing protein
MHKQRGFTLIELSIVLVIIGLIIGGVLVGQDLIKAAQMRAQISDIEKLNTAVNAFKLKYNCLPGDCATATRFFTATSQPEQVTNGSGNGLISTQSMHVAELTSGDQNAAWLNSNSASLIWAEWTMVYDHLAAAGLLTWKQYDEGAVTQGTGGAGTACSKLRFSYEDGTSDVINATVPTCMSVGYIPGYLYITSGHKIAFNGGTLLAGVSGGLNPWDAFDIDRKIDDGLPLTGIAKVMSPNYIYRYTDSGVSYCNSGNAYLTRSNVVIGGGGRPRIRTCDMVVNASF